MELSQQVVCLEVEPFHAVLATSHTDQGPALNICALLEVDQRLLGVLFGEAGVLMIVMKLLIKFVSLSLTV
jgi:hypothetical protein